MKKLFGLICAVFLFHLLFAQTASIDPVLLEIPRIKPNEKVIHRTGFSFSYNEDHEQANWVAYELTRQETTKIYHRTNRFKSDPLVETGTANDNDYKGSGLDRGHLAPAADMSWSLSTMRESFYYSNISPQYPSFNRGIWKVLEDQTRTWAIENEAVYIVTGPVLNAPFSTIGKNKVSIPKYFYKVILDYREPIIKGIGFIIPNTKSNLGIQSYALSIDSVEKFAGIDFFPALPDHQEKIIESSLDLKLWTWF